MGLVYLKVAILMLNDCTRLARQRPQCSSEQAPLWKSALPRSINPSNSAIAIISCLAQQMLQESDRGFEDFSPTAHIKSHGERNPRIKRSTKIRIVHKTGVNSAEQRHKSRRPSSRVCRFYRHPPPKPLPLGSDASSPHHQHLASP